MLTPTRVTPKLSFMRYELPSEIFLVSEVLPRCIRTRCVQLGVRQASSKTEMGEEEAAEMEKHQAAELQNEQATELHKEVVMELHKEQAENLPLQAA